MIPYFKKMAPAVGAVGWAGIYLAKYQPWNGVSAGRATIQALNKMNDNLVDSLPARVGRVATNTIELNNIDSLFFYPPCHSGSECNGARSMQGSSLPVGGRGSGFAEMCLAAMKGSDGSARLNFDRLGYPRDKGPYTGGGSSDNPHVKDYISKETKSYDFSVLLDFSGHIELSLGEELARFKSKYPYPEWIWGTENSPLLQGTQTEDDNEFTRALEGAWNGICFAGGIGGLLGATIGGLLPTPYMLAGGDGLVGLGNLLGLGGAMGTISAACTRLPEDFHFLAYAARTTQSRISAGGVYISALPRDYAYGQSCVFNPQSLDLYTQDWQSKMMRATHMDQPGDVIAAMENQAPDPFSDLVEALKRAGNTDAFKIINVH
jgi:hypothetical protein